VNESHKLSNDPVKRGHETSDANAKSVTINGIGLSVGLMVFGILFCWGVYALLKPYSPTPGEGPRTFATVDSTNLPPLPRLQADPEITLAPFVEEQEARLNSYGWVNKDSGIVHIPIERAMKLTVERGLPAQAR
jgi:hypothetical protein